MFPCSAWISHCSRVTPYGEIYLGQHWLGYWLVAWRHQAIIWTIFYLYSEKPSDRHPKDTSVINLYNEHKNILSHNLSKFSFKSSSDQWVNLGSIVSSHASQYEIRNTKSLLPLVQTSSTWRLHAIKTWRTTNRTNTNRTRQRACTQDNTKNIGINSDRLQNKDPIWCLMTVDIG